jgi:hypothetical protein
MKKLLLVIFLFQSFIGIGQSVTKTLSEKKIGYVNCTNKMKIDMSKNDTTYTIYCGFQNKKYQHITDLGSVFMMTKETLDKTISDLNECVKYMDDKSISFSIGSFEIYDFSKNLFIMDDDKYTTLNKKNVLKWIKWLEGCVVN